ncbi:MAG: hypothetical protein PHG23_00640 [Candidatus Pacebacteria bacterium]|nr:hypothetical protein [Candidatus Paceibacterota bacterium]
MVSQKTVIIASLAAAVVCIGIILFLLSFFGAIMNLEAGMNIPETTLMSLMGSGLLLTGSGGTIIGAVIIGAVLPRNEAGRPSLKKEFHI